MSILKSSDYSPFPEGEAAYLMYKGCCDLCGGEYYHDEGLYEGHRLEIYGDIFCCDTCWRFNHDGWNPTTHEPRLIKILEGKNMPIPERNEAGFLPRN